MRWLVLAGGGANQRPALGDRDHGGAQQPTGEQIARDQLLNHRPGRDRDVFDFHHGLVELGVERQAERDIAAALVTQARKFPPIFTGADEGAKAETRAATAWVLDQILILLHPVMPYITEELWEQLSPGGIETRPGRLIATRWPSYDRSLIDAEAGAEMDWVVRLISSVRTVRSEMNVPAGSQISLLVRDAGPAAGGRLSTHRDLIQRLARLAAIELHSGAAPHGSVQTVLDEATLILPLAGIIDLDQERARLRKEIARLEGEIVKVDKKLGNADFMAKAPEEVVEENRERRAEAATAVEKLRAALDMLAN